MRLATVTTDSTPLRKGASPEHLHVCPRNHPPSSAVAEYQKRGLVHFHAVIRLDGPDGSDKHLPASASLDALTNAVLNARGRVRLTVDSTTLGALRDVRRAWRTAQTRAQLGLADRDETTLVVESSWAFLGTGYAPGEELLAATVREQRALALQLKHEGETG